MKRLLLLFVLLAPALAQSPGDLKQLELEMAKLLVKGDFDQYATRLADDYLRINMNGTAQNKQQTLDYLKSGATRFLEIDPDNLNIRFYGDCVIVNGDLTAVQRINGKVVTTTARFTDAFARKDGQWILTTTQFTTAPK